MPLTNVTLATPLLTGLGVTAEGDVVQPDIDNRTVLNDVLVKVNDVDISDLCTHVSFQSSTDERDVTTYGSRNRVRRLGAIYRIEVQLDLILGTDEATSLVPTSELLPTSQQLLTGAAGDVWTGIQFDQLFDSDLPTRVEISPRRFPVPPIDGNPLYEVPCRITKWTRLVGGVGEPASASLTLVGTAALGVARGARAIVTPPPVSTVKIIVVSTAVEVSTAQGLARRIPVLQVVELEVPQTVARRGVVAAPVEGEQSLAVVPRKTRGVTQVTESNATQNITIRKTRALVQVTDTEIGTQFSVRGTLGRAITVETAQPVAKRKARTVAQALDTEQSTPLTRGALGSTLYPSNTLYPSDTLYPAFFLAPQTILVDPADDEFDTANPMVVAKSGAARPRAGFPFPITPAAPPPAITAFDPLFAVSGGSGRNAQPAFQYAPLPTNVAIDATVNQAAFQTELNSRAQASRSINSLDFTTRRIVVPDAQTLEPILLWRADWGGGFTGTNYPPFALNADQICRAGFPLPANYAPLTTSDKGLALLQPDYQAPQWATLPVPLVGRMFEGWIVEPNPAYNPAQPKVWPNYAWRCGWPGRVGGLNVFPGHFVDWTTNSPQASWPYQGYDGTNPANPDSTFQQITLGAAASGIAIADSEILVEDLNRNINGGQWGLGHCVGLNVPTVGGFRWPAQRSDATSASTYPIHYGMRLCLPANFVIPSNVHPVCRALIQNCIVSDDPARRGYGLVVHEQSGSAVLFKAQPGAEAYWAGVTSDVVLNGFPWNQLQVIQAGDDTSPIRLAAGPAVPANTTPPVVAGPTTQGQTLGLYRGIWSGGAPIAYTFQWQRSANGTTWTDIAGATGQAYLIQAADVGNVLRGAVTATNSVGTTTAFTAATSVIVSGAAAFMRDSFTGVDGVTVESRPGEIGSTWTKHAGSTATTSDLIRANRAMGPAVNSTNVYYASAVPPSADYTVTVLINELSDNESSHASAAARISTTDHTLYFAQYLSNGDACTLFRVNNNVFTQLGATVTLKPTTSVAINVIGDQISFLADGATIIGPITDATISAAGRAGYRHGGVNTTTTGIHIENVEAAVNPVVPVTFSSDSFTGTNGATVISRAGEVGATWTRNPVSTGASHDTIQNNRAMGPAASGTNVYYSSGVPPTADYSVTLMINQLSDNNSSHCSAAGRMSTTQNTMYYTQYNTATNILSLLLVFDNGTSVVVTTLGTVAVTPTVSITLKMVGDQISGYADDVLVLGPVTDTTLTGPGRAGYRHGGLNSTSTGLHIDYFEAVTIVGTGGGATPTSARSSLSIPSTSGIGNITVTFNKPYQVGQFANGDNFVLPDPTLGTVVVTAMTPTYTTGRHGYAVNPKATAFNVSNSFDNRGSDDSAFVAPPALPLSLTPDQSLIKVASMTTQTSFSWIDNAAVITVLATAPPVGTMRPAAFGTDKRLISSTTISGSLFPNLPAAAVPTRLTYAQCIARCEPFRNDYHPGPSWGYYRSSASAVPGGLTWGGDVLKSDIELLCSLCLDHLTATEKKDIAIRYAQHGIDTWGVSVPATGGGAGFLRGGGANGAGHLLSLSFAAWLTADTAIQTFLDNASETTWNPAGGAGIGAAAFLYWETASFYRSSVTSQALWGKKWETFIGDSEAGYWSDLNVPAGVGGVNNATLRDPYERIDGGPVPGGSYQDTVSHQIMGLAALMDVMAGFQAVWPSLVQNDAVLREYGHRWELNGIRTAPDPVAPKTATGAYGVNYGPNPQTGTGGPGYDGTGVNGYIGGSGRAPTLNNTGAHGGNRFSQLTDNFVTAYSTATGANNFTARPASSFADSIGINIHASATVASGSAYGPTQDIIDAINYVGFKHFRDSYQAPGLSSDAPGNVALKQESIASQTGALICLMLDEQGLLNQLDDQAHVNQSVGWIKQFMPHVLILEGENEADNGAIGGSGPARAQQRQQWLRAAWTDTLLGPSYINNTNYATNQAAFMDASNAHPYPPNTQALDTIARLDGQLTAVKKQAPGKPVYSTETGYSQTVCIGRTAITELQQARWTISEVLLNIRQGAVKVYLYELFNNDGCNWGLFSHTTPPVPKPGATLLRDWMTLMRDTGTSPTTASLGYTFTGAQELALLLWAKSDGSFLLTFWPTVDRGTNRTFTMTPVRNAQFIQLYQPHLGTAVQQQFSNVAGGTAVTIGPITDDPFIVKVIP